MSDSGSGDPGSNPGGAIDSNKFDTSGAQVPGGAIFNNFIYLISLRKTWQKNKLGLSPITLIT